MGTYKIVRFYYSGRKKVIRKGVSLEAARSHCSREDTRKEGVWFDGYTKD